MDKKLNTSNDITLDAYNQCWPDYITNTPPDYLPHHEPLLRWMEHALSQLAAGSRILEIGSGNGRETSYMSSKGYHVIPSDGAKAWVDFLNSQGHDAKLINILRDDIDEVARGCRMVFANAVVPHFTKIELQTTLKKVGAALDSSGLFAFSAKQGDGDEWVNEKLGIRRFIHYWDPDELVQVVLAAGYEVIFCEANIPGDLPTHTWINLTARKR